MTRTRKSAKQAGSKFESDVVAYLAEHVDDRIERRARNGAKDRGDVSGLRVLGERVVLEAKNYGGRIMAAEWTKEAETERGNDDALVGVVAAKRKGTQAAGDQWVLMTMRDFVALVTGERPKDD